MYNYNFATANLSFAFALGKKMGSEKKWLEKIAESNTQPGVTPDEFLKNKAEDTMNLIANELIEARLDAIGLQELNEYNYEPGIKTFENNFIKATGDTVVDYYNKVERETPSNNVEVNIKCIGKYCIISFGVIKDKGVATVALIYNTEKLGFPNKIFCEDCEVAGHNGRPMLGVITNKDCGLISMHAPNVNPYLMLNKNQKLRKLMDGEKMQNYFKSLANKDTVLDDLNKIYRLIDNEFMTPMVEKITNFIIKLRYRTNKIVLMGDMNDPYPNNKESLSNKLKNTLGLQFFPGNPTCCYNWDSSRLGDSEKEYTNWIFGNSHPEDTINEEAIARQQGIVEDVKNKKSQKKNYVFRGDLIYFTEGFKNTENRQVELFPQYDDEISQYSDHVFQKITLADNFDDLLSAGGKKKHTKRRRSTKKRRPTKRRKLKKVRKSKKVRRPTKRR